jgi:hypothetical protein
LRFRTPRGVWGFMAYSGSSAISSAERRSGRRSGWWSVWGPWLRRPLLRFLFRELDDAALAAPGITFHACTALTPLQIQTLCSGHKEARDLSLVQEP